MRVLLVEDNPGDARLIHETLGEAMAEQVQLDWVVRLAEAFARLETEPVHDIILLDLSLPDSQGLETFRSLHAKAPHAAVIVLTGTDNQTLAMQAIEEGAQDYLVKGQMAGSLLVRAMGYAIRRQRIEEELRQAKDAAESANRSKSQFLANMSHEIRTPLNAVVGMLDLALTTELTNEQREYLLTIETATASLLDMINEVLDFAKIEAGKLELDPLEMDLRESLVGVLDLLAPRAHSKGLELAWRVDPAVPHLVQCDPGRFRQILFNLVGNAIKFTERGEVAVEIEAESGADGEGIVSVAVRDTGIGIPPEMINDIFLPFVQVDGSTTRKYGGTGLGLSVTSRLVGLMRGRLDVWSELNRGSTFQIRLPLPPAPGPKAPAPFPGVQALRGLRVLVVDDNATQRRVLTELLTQWQLDCETAANGTAALVVLDRARRKGPPFQFVLADSEMPDMDGLTLAERCRGRSGGDVELILMRTSTGPRHTPDRLRSLGIATCITKPIKPMELVGALLAATAHAPEIADRPASIRQVAKAPGWRPLHILLVEDNPFNQRVASLILGKRGHTVEVVGNGLDAVVATDRQRFDVVLMDVQMPVMDGFEATAVIRANEQSNGHRQPIIAMTAHALKKDREGCLAAGMDGYLSKPVQAEILIELVEQFGASGSPAPEAARTSVPSSPIAVNFDAALERVSGDRTFFGEMTAVFLEESPDLLSRIRESITLGDLRRAGIAAHALKNWANGFVAPLVCEAAEILEEQLDSGAVDLAKTSFEPLERAIERLTEELVAFSGASQAR